MTFEELQLTDNVELAGWIPARLGGRFGAMTRTVPDGYPAYARICHPVRDREGELVTWADVAAMTGRHAHPLMQWHALVGSADPTNITGSLWPGDDPELGHLVPEALGALTAVLAGHTTTPTRCMFCLWEGWGWLSGGFATLTASSSSTLTTAHKQEVPLALSGLPAPSQSPQLRPVRSPGSTNPGVERDQPKVRLPGREYLLLTGPLHAATSLGHWSTPTSFLAQSPNLFWPTDRAWFVATEIDFNSTLVAGTRALIDALLRAPDLDSWPVDPDDSLASDGDQVNRV